MVNWTAGPELYWTSGPVTKEVALTTQRRERADAIRNRSAILRATEELLSSRPADEITVEQVAAAAGVGKATVFHRFGSKSGLLTSLMRERAQDLSAALEDGPPPLGPGAPPRERILAFLEAAVELVGRNKGMAAALDMSCRPPGPDVEERPVYQTWHAHLSEQLRLVRADLDHEMAAHLLLSGLHSGPMQRHVDRAELERLAAALRQLALGILPQAVSRRTPA